MKKLSNLIIVLGLLVILSPIATKKYADYKSQQILQALENEMKNLGEVNYNLVQHEFEDEYINTDNSISKEEQMEGSIFLELEHSVTVEDNAPNQEITSNTIIKIEKIDLKLPVLKGIAEESLKYGIGSFRNDIGPGDLGNYSLAGHRSYTYGSMFNRLDELQEGDSIEIVQNKQNFVYKVVDTFIVNPEDTWVLKNEKNKKTITLVTCHPIRIANQRLIVKGELVENQIEGNP